MKKLLVLMMTLVMVVSLFGCNKENNSQNDDTDMQISTDMVEKVKEYAKSLFHEYLNTQNVTNYEITKTNYGFITDEPVVFIIGYEYTVDESEYLYGYKLSLNEDLSFTVVEEGEAIGEFIMR